ncbi:MAG: DNA polymerase III subunit delta [Caldilineaceae bacterium]
MIRLFLNADEYLVQERLTALKHSLGDADMVDLNTTIFDASATAAEIAAQAAMMPFLSEKRLVIVRGYLDALDKRMAASKDTHSNAHAEVARLGMELTTIPDSCEVIFIDSQVDKRRGLWKGFTIPAKEGKAENKVLGLEGLSKAKTITIEELAAPDAKALPGWIQQRAKEKKVAIDGKAVQMLAEFVGADLRRLDNELEKLSLYTDGKTITAEAIKLMVADVSEAVIWELTESLSQRNPRGAMAALYELRQGPNASSSGNPFYLLTMIARQFRTIIKVKDAMQSMQGDEFAVAKEIGENPFPVKKAMAQVGRYSWPELDRIMERLLQADYAMKTGADQDTEIDLVVAELTKK